MADHPAGVARLGFDEMRELLGDDLAAQGLRRLRELTAVLLQMSPSSRLEIQAHAHALVSHAALFGFQELSRRCKTLEESCRSDLGVAPALEAAKREAVAALDAISCLAETL